MEVRIDSSWKEILGAEFDKEYFVRLTEFVRAEYGRRTVYPPASKSLQHSIHARSTRSRW